MVVEFDRHKILFKSEEYLNNFRRACKTKEHMQTLNEVINKICREILLPKHDAKELNLPQLPKVDSFFRAVNLLEEFDAYLGFLEEHNSKEFFIEEVHLQFEDISDRLNIGAIPTAEENALEEEVVNDLEERRDEIAVQKCFRLLDKTFASKILLTIVERYKDAKKVNEAFYVASCIPNIHLKICAQTSLMLQ